jgi:hypothetical protein
MNNQESANLVDPVEKIKFNVQNTNNENIYIKHTSQYQRPVF